METSDVRQHVWELMQQHSTLTDRGEACADTQNLLFQSLAALLQPGETPLAYHHEPGSGSTDAYAYPHGEATKQTDAFLYDHGPDTRETNAFLYPGQDNPASDVLGYARTTGPCDSAGARRGRGVSPGRLRHGHASVGGVGSPRTDQDREIGGRAGPSDPAAAASPREEW